MASAAETRNHEWISLVDCDSSLQEEILAESQYILSHPSFRNSRRCVTLFKHLMECLLKGDQESLKERVLGVAVFGRDPSYDPSVDPIVRITANEIRKRLAQCYEGEHQSRIRIHLIPGSYSPQIEIVKNEVTAHLVETSPPHPEEIEGDERTETGVEARSSTATAKKARSIFFVCILSFGVLSAGFITWFLIASHLRSTQELIWAPLLHTNEPILICVSDIRGGNLDPDNWTSVVADVIATRKIPAIILKDHHVPAMSLVDAMIAAKVMAAITSQRHEAIMRGASTVTLDDLRQSPDVVIGAFDNPWFLILFSRLRFHVMVDPVTQDEWIEDSRNPGRREWLENGKTQFADSSVDYALIIRYRSPDTGKWILAIGGLGKHGTAAAGELLTSHVWLNTIPKNLVEAGNNFQIVVKTTVINGNVGPPQIVASYSW
jgi:hypothetical protein